MFIDPSQVRPKFTSSIIANYKAYNPPTSLLQGKFKPVGKRTKYLEWNVKRYGETVATDVVRGADGNINQFSNMTRKIEEPPFYYELINVMQVTGYDRAFPDQGLIDESAYNDFRTNMLFEIQQTQFKMDRTRELQAREVLLSGTVTTRVNGSTDFNRRPASILPFNAAYDWTQPTVDPRTILQTGCAYQRAYGQSNDAIYDCFMGKDAYNALIVNPFIVEAEKFHVNELTAADVTRRNDGSVLMKILNCGDFRVHIYTYPQVYTPYGITDLSGAGKVAYIPGGAVILTPMNAEFMTGYTVPPILPNEVLAGRTEGMFENATGSIDRRYYISEFIDQRLTGWFVAIKSCFLTVPIAVDQIFTVYVTP